MHMPVEFIPSSLHFLLPLMHFNYKEAILISKLVELVGEIPLVPEDDLNRVMTNQLVTDELPHEIVIESPPSYENMMRLIWDARPYAAALYDAVSFRIAP